MAIFNTGHHLTAWTCKKRCSKWNGCVNAIVL